MFLIQISKTNFIDAEKILIIRIEAKNIRVWLAHTNVEEDEHFFVDDEFHDSFINHLQGLNSGIANIETTLKKIKGDEK